MTGRGLRGRQFAQLMLCAAFVVVACEAILFLTPPSFMGAGFADRQLNWISLVVPICVAAQAFGLVWMIRLYPADAEAHGNWWRSQR